MEKINVIFCAQILICCILEFAYGDQRELLNLIATASPQSSTPSTDGDGSVIQPYKGPCMPRLDEFGIHLTFPGHLEHSSKSAGVPAHISASDIFETLQKVLETDHGGFNNDCQRMVTLLNHLIDENQQEIAIREYGKDDASITIAFGSLRNKLLRVKKLLQDLNLILHPDEIQGKLLPMAMAMGHIIDLLKLFEHGHKHPLLFAPYFFTYAGVYYSAVNILIKLEQNEDEHYYANYMNKLVNLIEIYKVKAIEERQKQVNGYWPMHCKLFSIFWPTSCYNPKLTDQLSEDISREVIFSSDFTLEEAKSCYRGGIRLKYEPFFSVFSQLKALNSHFEGPKAEHKNMLVTEKKSSKPSRLLHGSVIGITILSIAIFLIAGSLISFFILKMYVVTSINQYPFDTEEAFEFNPTDD